MSKLQFISLLAPSVGSFVLVILAWLHSNGRLTDLKESMNRQFDAVDRRFGEINRRLELIEREQKEFFTVTAS